MYSDARLTIRLPGEYLQFAQQYARERHMSMTELVVGYFKRLKESHAGADDLSPSVKQMIGIIPAGSDAMEDYHDHLMEKHACGR